MSLVRRGVLATLIALTGCYHAVARSGQQAGAEETRTGWNLFWGLFDANFDITNCPNGIAYAEVWHPWWGFVPEIITLGIAAPQRLTYVCSAATAQMQPAVIMQQPGYAPPPAPMPQYQPQPAPPPAAAPYQPPAPAATEAPASDDATPEEAPKPAKKTKKAKKKKKPATDE